MKNLFKLDLQFFAEGSSGAGASGAAASSPADSGQASGGQATADAAQRLRELGVPESKIRKRARTAETSAPSRTDPVKVSSDAEAATAAAQETTPTEKADEPSTPKRPSWDEIKRDPEYEREYKREMQNAIQARLKAEKNASQPAKDALAAMTPAIEVMARKYGLDAKNMDYAALAKAIENDDAYYEQKAMEMGTSIDTAKRVDQLERAEARRKEAEAANIQQQAVRNHFLKLENQGEALKATFPTFDLRQELKNPTFARLVSPGVGLSVEDAYYSVHRKEIQAASMQVAAKKTAEKISASIQSGGKRPDELGASSKAPSVSTFDYRNASRAEREALKKQIRDAAARGEKLYPGK